MSIAPVAADEILLYVGLALWVGIRTGQAKNGTAPTTAILTHFHFIGIATPLDKSPPMPHSHVSGA